MHTVIPWLAFLCGFWRPNSEFHANPGRNLSTESSPQPHNLYLFIYLVHFIYSGYINIATVSISDTALRADNLVADLPAKNKRTFRGLSIHISAAFSAGRWERSRWADHLTRVTEARLTDSGSHLPATPLPLLLSWLERGRLSRCWTQIHGMWNPTTLSAVPWESTHAKEKPPGRGYPWHKRWCGGCLGTCLKRTQIYILIWLSDFITKHLLKTNKL